MSTADTQSKIQEFFDRPVAVKATSPLSADAEVLIKCDTQEFTLSRKGKKNVVTEGAPAKPDMTFEVPPKALDILLGTHTEEVGEIGIAIASHMIHPNPEQRVTSKIHIGLMSLIRKGYLSILPLGGASFMKYLATKGLTSMSKIRETISKMKD
jgi:hypothetical protein